MKSSDQVSCSVIICVRNGADTLRVQLQALADQVDAPPFEVIVVDNGSTDATTDLYRAWARRDTGAVTSTRIVDASDRAGLAHARNRGAEAAQCDLLAYCDADDMVGETWVRSAHRAITEGDWQAVGGQVLTLTDLGPSPNVLMAELDGIGPAEGADRGYPYFWGCNFALTKDAFLAAKGFDENLPPYGWDDVDIGIRLGRAGIDIGYVPQMSVHYAPPSGLVRRLRRKFRAGTAQACVQARHPEVFVNCSARNALASLPARVWQGLASPGRLATRFRRGAEASACSLGQLWGWVQWVRPGRLGRPRYFGEEEFDEPVTPRG